jgi:hypothetical protein
MADETFLRTDFAVRFPLPMADLIQAAFTWEDFRFTIGINPLFSK